MAKAKVTFSDGKKAIITGTPEEIEAAVEEYEASIQKQALAEDPGVELPASIANARARHPLEGQAVLAGELVRGVGETATRTGEMARRLDPSVPLESEQPVLERAPMGIGGPGPRRAQTPEEKEAERQQITRDRAMRSAETDLRQDLTGLPKKAQEVAFIAGEVAPDFLAGGLAGASRSALRRIGGEAIVGAIAGGASQADAQDLGSAMLLGAGLGAGIGAAIEFPAAYRWIRLRNISDVVNSPEAEAARAAAERAGIDLTLAEQTGDEFIKGLEANIAENQVQGSMGNARYEFYRKRNNQILESYAKAEETLNVDGLPVGAKTAHITGAVRDTVGELKKARAAEFNDRLKTIAPAVGAEVDDAGRIVGGDRFIKIDGLIGELDAQIKRLEDTPGLADPSEIKSLKKQRDAYAAINEQGGMTLGQYQDTRSVLSRDTRARGNLNSALDSAQDRLESGRLLDALESDATSIDGVGRDVIEEMRIARENYAADSDMMREIQRRAANKILVDLAGANAEEFSQTILSMNADDLTELMDLVRMGGGDPDIVRSQAFKYLIDKHTKPVAEAGGEVGERLDVKGFLRELTNKGAKRMNILTGEGQHPALGSNTDELIDATNILIRIRDLGAEGINRLARDQSAIGKGAEALTPTSLGKLPWAVANAIIKWDIGPAKMEKLLFTPKGNQLLLELNRAHPGRGATADGGAAVILTLMDDIDAEIEAERKAAMQAQIEYNRRENAEANAPLQEQAAQMQMQGGPM